MENNIKKKIKNIYNSIENKNKNEIINNINELINMNNDEKNEYYDALLHPENKKDVKIPSKLSIPTCTFQLHMNRIIAGKNFRLMFNPFFLYNKKYVYPQNQNTYYSSYGKFDYYGNLFNGNHRGYYIARYFTSMIEIYESTRGNGEYLISPIDIEQGIPPMYNQYRLVSACISLKYIGKADAANGMIGGAIITEESPFLNGKIFQMVLGETSAVVEANMRNDEFKKYYNYNLVLNSTYHKQVNCVDGIRLLYFPIDNSYEEFVNVLEPNNIINVDYYKKGRDDTGGCYLKGDKNYKNGFNFYIYTLNNFYDNPWDDELLRYKLDVYCNFECIPYTEYIKWLPLNINLNYINNNDKREIIELIQGKCITQLNKVTNILKWKDILKQLKYEKILDEKDKNNNEENNEEKLNKDNINK